MDNVEDYTEAAQVAQFFQYKALAEGYSYRMWDWYSALFLWKASSPSPTFRGALYDTFLETNGGYWGWRDGFGGGSHVRIVLNQKDWTIHVINSLPIQASIVSCEWRAYSLQGKELGGEIANIPILVHGNSVHRIKHISPSWVGGTRSSPLAESYGVQDVVLYKLQLAFKPHRRIGIETYTNRYFLTDPTREDSQSRLSLLGVLRKFYTVNVDASCHLRSKDSIECVIKNSSRNAAIMSKLSLVYSQTTRLGISREIRVLPTSFTSNYIPLLPGETHKVALTALHTNFDFICSKQGQAAIEGRGVLSIKLDGWNVEATMQTVLCMSPNEAATQQ